MLAKIGCVTIGIVLAMFAMARVENVARHRGFSESAAWAQESDDQADDAVSQDDGAAQDEAASQDDAGAQDELAVQHARHKSICKVCGNYSGQIISNSLGTGTFMLGIIPANIPFRSKLLGTWIESFDNTQGFMKGTVNSKGGLSLQFRLNIKGHCLFNFHGTFENGNEISGTYNTNGCSGPSDSGTIDITD
jgi:hypothetical protein